MPSPTRAIMQEVERLRRELQEHDYRYYVLAEPTIADEEYDRLMRHLQDLEASYPALRTPDSPTQRVGGQPTKEFPTVTHVPRCSASRIPIPKRRYGTSTGACAAASRMRLRCTWPS